MPSRWTRAENEATVADYISMLRDERAGVRFNKAEHNRNLRTQLSGRNRSAVEKKHQNISAILIELGYPYVIGYQPLPNYQADLRALILERVEADVQLRALLEAEAQRPADVPSVEDILATLEEPPRGGKRPKYPALSEPSELIATRNYLEMESRNASLGQAGEEYALRFERARLTLHGRQHLADRVEHISRSRGDGAGFDIHSYEVDGTDRLIEAKTTAYGRFTPFFLSRNEVSVSLRHDRRWHLYRMHSFRDSPRLFILPGRVDHSCRMDATQFLARVL